MPRNQMEIPGTEAPRIGEIEDLAETYVRLRDKRIKLLEQELSKKVELLAVMQAHAKDLPKDKDNNPVYRFGDEMVILKTGRSNVKVKHVQDETDEDED